MEKKNTCKTCRIRHGGRTKKRLFSGRENGVAFDKLCHRIQLDTEICHAKVGELLRKKNFLFGRNNLGATVGTSANCPMISSSMAVLFIRKLPDTSVSSYCVF